MGTITKVQACNIVRSASNLAPISTTAQDAKVLQSLNLAIVEISGGKYPYNTDKTTLTPNSSNKIDVSEYISFELPKSNSSYAYLVEKDGYLWDTQEQEYWSSEIEDALVTSLPKWEDIPTSWQLAIAHKAAVSFMIMYKGITNDTQYWTAKAYNSLCAAELETPSSMNNATGITSRINDFGGMNG